MYAVIPTYLRYQVCMYIAFPRPDYRYLRYDYIHTLQVLHNHCCCSQRTSWADFLFSNTKAVVGS